MTRRQLQVLNYIRGYVAEHGLAPSRREISAAVGYKSVSRANAAVDALVACGRIRRIPKRHRAIELVTDSVEVMILKSMVDALHATVTDLRNQLAQYQGVAA